MPQRLTVTLLDAADARFLLDAEKERLDARRDDDDRPAYARAIDYRRKPVTPRSQSQQRGTQSLLEDDDEQQVPPST